VEMTVKFDLPVEQVNKMLEPTWSGPLGRVALRMSANVRERMASNLAGPSVITISDGGIRATTAGGERQIEWSSVRTINERTQAWMIVLEPSGLCMIPVDAVPAAQHQELIAHLRTAVGSKYKVREGGIRKP